MITPSQTATLLAVFFGGFILIGLFNRASLHTAGRQFDSGNYGGCLVIELISWAVVLGGAWLLCRFAEVYP